MLEDLFAAHVEGMREALDLPKLEQRLCTLEAKAKDAPTAQAPPSLAQVPPDHDYATCWCHYAQRQPKPLESDRIPHERSEYGWRAREFDKSCLALSAENPCDTIEIHHRAERVREHKMNGVWLGPCKYPESCKLEHAEFLQISSEPAVKGGSNG
jgi:hypothetical protein